MQVGAIFQISMKDLEALKLLSGTATQLLVVIGSLLGIISMVIKQIIDKQKKNDDLKDLLSSIKSDVQKLKNDLKAEIDENERQIKDLDFSSQRYFAEILKAVNTGKMEHINEVIARMVIDLQDKKESKP